MKNVLSRTIFKCSVIKIITNRLKSYAKFDVKISFELKIKPKIF